MLSCPKCGNGASVSISTLAMRDEEREREALMLVPVLLELYADELDTVRC